MSAVPSAGSDVAEKFINARRVCPASEFQNSRSYLGDKINLIKEAIILRQPA
jgi:hypothetical protein